MNNREIEELTDEQKTKIRRLSADLAARIEEIRVRRLREMFGKE